MLPRPLSRRGFGILHIPRFRVGNSARAYLMPILVAVNVAFTALTSLPTFPVAATWTRGTVCPIVFCERWWAGWRGCHRGLCRHYSGRGGRGSTATATGPDSGRGRGRRRVF